MKDLDSLAAREILEGNFPCHTFGRSSSVVSSSSADDGSAGCSDWDIAAIQKR